MSFEIDERIEILNKEDAIRLERCGWMRNRYYQKSSSLKDRIKEANWWYSKFCEYLPTPYLVKMQKQCNRFSMIFELSKFEKLLKRTRIEIIYIYSSRNIDLTVKKKESLPYPREWNMSTAKEETNTKTTFEQFKQSQVIVNPNCNPELERPTIATVEAWGTVIEVVEHYGMKIVKYDLFKNNYCIIIYTAGEMPRLLYDKDASDLEKEADEILDKHVNKQMEYNKNKNPYGNRVMNNKKNSEIDISNIQQAMGMSNDLQFMDDSQIDDIF